MSWDKVNLENSEYLIITEEVDSGIFDNAPIMSSIKLFFPHL